MLGVEIAAQEGPGLRIDYGGAGRFGADLEVAVEKRELRRQRRVGADSGRVALEHEPRDQRGALLGELDVVGRLDPRHAGNVEERLDRLGELVLRHHHLAQLAEQGEPLQVLRSAHVEACDMGRGQQQPGTADRVAG